MKKSAPLLSLLLTLALLLTGIIATTAQAGETPAVEFTFMAKTRAPYDPEMMDIWNELMARTNAKINFMWVPQANFTEKVNAVLASGDIPEVIFEPDMALMLNQGAILPLDELIDEYAPNYKALLTDADYVYLRQSIDGQVYHLSHILDFPPSMTTLIRKDWADGAGMALPQTWADWMGYWEYVRDNDANGDGDAKNEIPLVVDSTNTLLELTNWFGIKINNSYFATSDEDTIIGLYDHPNFRAYLETMIELYNNGILDKEFATRSADYKSVLDTSIAGSTVYYAERAKLTTDVLRETNATAAFYPVAPVYHDDPSQQMIKARAKVATTGAVLTVTAEDKGIADEIMTFYNYVYSQEGSDLLNYGIVGQHCDLVDGKYKIKDEITAGGFNEARKVGIVPSITPYNFLSDAYLQILLGGKAYEDLPESTQYFHDGLFLNEPYFYYQVPVFSTETYVEEGAQLTEKLISIFARTVAGELTVDQFFSEYDSIKASGWQTIIDEQQAAYELIKAAK